MEPMRNDFSGKLISIVAILIRLKCVELGYSK
jgi:hypothetical protein